MTLKVFVCLVNADTETKNWPETFRIFLKVDKGIAVGEFKQILFSDQKKTLEHLTTYNSLEVFTDNNAEPLLPDAVFGVRPLHGTVMYLYVTYPPLPPSVESVAKLESQMTRVSVDAFGVFPEYLAQSDYAAAWKVFLARCGSYSKVDSDPCVPRRLNFTWNAGVISTELQLKSTSLDRNNSGGRNPRLLGLRMGPGCGKTHMLLAAPKLLGISSNVYITYDNCQNTAFDARFPQSAILLRILLRLAGVANIECPDFFASNEGVLNIRAAQIIPLVVYVVKQSVAKVLPTKFFVGIDEIRQIALDPLLLQAATSAVGNLVVALQDVGVETTVLISALTEATFATESGRPIEELTLPMLTEEGRNFVLKSVFPLADSKQLATIALVAGCHFRSLVVASLELEGGLSLDLPTLHNKLRSRLGYTITIDELGAIRNYIPLACAIGVVNAKIREPLARPFTNIDGSIHPVLACHAFHEAHNFLPTNTHCKSCLREAFSPRRRSNWSCAVTSTIAFGQSAVFL